jgi:hypothetical protein
MSDTQQPGVEPIPRVVLLGASNLTRSISTAVAMAQLHFGQQLEVLVGSGHGRSYGLKSWFLGRSLPPILECRLWNELARRSNVPTTAMITDIGNDILFNVPVSVIAVWIETVLDRLEQANSRVSMTLLPVTSAVKVGEFRFHFFRRLYVPGCQLSLSEVLHRAHELTQRLEEIGRARNVKLIEQPDDWYGIDPIHIRLRRWRDVWHEAFSPWSMTADRAPFDVRGSLSRWIYLRTRRPHERTFLGREQRANQPVGALRGGTTISFF